MSIKKLAIAVFSLLFTAGMAFAADITIEHPYARVSMMMAKSGGAFMQISNNSAENDRLISASSDAANMVQIHENIIVDGIAKMRELTDGIVIPANGTAMLQRGGNHIMLMGLVNPLMHGDVITITLVFENAGEITIEVPVDNERDTMNGEMMMENSGMTEGNMESTSD